MNRGLKFVLAVIVLLFGLFQGTVAMASRESDMSGRLWAFFFVAGAVLFWIWITREERSAHDTAQRAADAANKKMDEMEQAARRIETRADVPPRGKERVVITQAEPVMQQEAPAEKPAPAPDDLTRINGIGARFAQMLNEAGITTYSQLSALSSTQIVEIIRAAGGRKSASMETWAEQAKLAAEGNWDALEKLQQELSKRQ
jgi:predicted flap endonuclease-1-like 5' DNA nuclease